MNIHIVAPSLPNQQSIKDFYTKDLDKKYGQFQFITSVEVKVTRENREYEVSLSLAAKQGPVLFATGSNVNENAAYQDAQNKIRRQIEKYKEVHYKKGQKL